MDICGPGRASDASCCLDLLRRHLRLFVRVRIRLDSRPHPRSVSCRGDDLFMAVGSGSVFICDLQNFWSGIADLHRRVRRPHRNRNGLVVACGSAQQCALKRRAAPNRDAGRVSAGGLLKSISQDDG